jgi:hypothetical protein
MNRRDFLGRLGRATAAAGAGIMRIRSLASPTSASAAQGRAGASVGGEFVLVEGGQPRATIVLSRTPTVAAAFAAKELRDHVRAITGASLPVVTDKAVVTGARVLIGESDATREYGLEGSGFREREHLIQFRDDTLILIGRDKAQPCELGDPVDLSNVPLPGWFDARDTLNAVYDFLELYCGVRWYHPTDVGTVCPTSPTLSVSRQDLRRQSDMMSVRGYFHAAYCLPGYMDIISNQQRDLWRLRMRMGGHPIQIDHSFYEYYDRFLAAHPDWFAQGYEGLEQPPQLCYTNPELIQQVVQDARDYFDGKLVFKRFPLSALPPGSDFFPLVPMDDMRWCKCDRCQAEFDPADASEAHTSLFSSGVASNYVWGFVNKVAREIRKTHPTKYVACIAYHDYASYPTKVHLEPNVAVQFCLWNLRGWHIPKLREVEQKNLDEWRTKGGKRPMFIWAYYMNPPAAAKGFGFEPFPFYFGHEAVRQMRLFHEMGVSAMWMAQTSEMGYSHLYDCPDGYVAMRMAENAGLDGDKILDEFFTLYYGAAAGPMRRLYDELEQTYTDPANYPAEWLESPNVRLTEELCWGHLGTAERMRRFQALLQEAQRAAATQMEKKRVEWFTRGIWRPMVKGARDHAALARRRAQPFHVSIPAAPDEYGGEPSKVDWAKAVDIGVLSSFVGIPNPIKRNIQVKLIHDGAWLYIQSVEDVDPAQLTDAYPFGARAYTDPMFSDSFVFMAAPEGADAARQFCVSGSGGGRTQSIYWAREDSGEWKERWKGISDTSLPHRWRVWIAIPLADLLPGGATPGATFRANVYRYCKQPNAMLVWRPHYTEDYTRAMKYMGEMTLE